MFDPERLGKGLRDATEQLVDKRLQPILERLARLEGYHDGRETQKRHPQGRRGRHGR